MNKKTLLVLSILVIVAVIVSFVFILNDSGETTQGDGTAIKNNRTSGESQKEVNDTTPGGSIEEKEGITRDMELDMESEMKEYNSSKEIMGFINQEFKIVEKQNKTMDPVYEIYKRKNGSEYEALRLARFMLLKNGLEAVYFVYDYGEVDAVVNFRDIEKPKYYYFENNKLNMKHHGWSFGDLILSEEERRGISIERIGVLNINRLDKRNELNLLNVSEWDERERWVN